ncbi:MAG TPA: SUMF1/EgtB/PvdO family nonheme iron enzyme [Gaiellaceae bacterium]
MTFDPLVPRELDLPTPIGGELDRAKIVAAPDDPAQWPAWRDALVAWRDRAREGYDGSAYHRLEWTQRCFAVALVWLWDERLYDHDALRFTPDRLLDEAEEQFGGYDGVVLWHAYPVIGIDERNQFDWYRDVPGLRELVDAFRARGVKVFVDYNPWDVGTRREPVTDAEAVAQVVRDLGADGVFLDTMKEAMPELRAALPDAAFEGESTLPTERVRDHHLSWAQWFADSRVPGVIRAKWFEQRHMLHHTRRWNRSHLDELHSAWLNGVGMLVWESVFGSWVGWNARDKELLRTMLSVQRRHWRLLAHGEWTPLAFGDGDVFAARWRDAGTELWAYANKGGDYDLGGSTIPAGGIAAVVDGEVVAVAGGGDATFPYRETVRREAPVAHVDEAPDGFVPFEPRSVTARFRRRETGTYGEVPYVEEWKPLPPRLHDWVHVDRPAPRGRFAIAREPGPAGLSLADARAYAAERGRRLPTEDEWQIAAEAGVLDGARTWEWTESEHSDGITRFCILKGGSEFRAEGSDWYVDGGPQPPEMSLKYLLPGPLQRSDRIAFRTAVDL